MGIDKHYRNVVAKGDTTTLKFRKGSSKNRGIASVASGDSFVVVSEANLSCRSGFPINLSLGVTTVASHRHLSPSVNSLVDDTSFAIVFHEATSGGSQEVAFDIIGG